MKVITFTIGDAWISTNSFQLLYDKCTESGNDFNLRDNATAVALCGASLDLETILHRRRVETALHSEVKCPATTNYQECRSVPVLMFSIDCYAAKYNLTYCGNLVSECVSIRTSPGNINLPRSSCSYFVTWRSRVCDWTFWLQKLAFCWLKCYVAAISLI